MEKIVKTLKLSKIEHGNHCWLTLNEINYNIAEKPLISRIVCFCQGIGNHKKNNQNIH
jgi:hypothetical protein